MDDRYKKIRSDGSVHLSSDEDSGGDEGNTEEIQAPDPAGPKPGGSVTRGYQEACRKEITLKGCPEMLWRPVSECPVDDDGRTVGVVGSSQNPGQKAKNKSE